MTEYSPLIMKEMIDTLYLGLTENLNDSDVNVRVESLRRLKNAADSGQYKVSIPLQRDYVNNHIHTTYSFSPYSPTKAVWMAYTAGLSTAGLMDHDTAGGAMEFIEAGKIVGIETTIGIECRVKYLNTPLNGRTINNPDQKSIAYTAIHGIPHNCINTMNNFFDIYRQSRNVRNTLMVEKLNNIMQPFGIWINYEEDIKPISNSRRAGTITERHILYGLAQKLIDKFGKGRGLVDFLRNKLKLDINAKIDEYLSDSENFYYIYDLLGVLKSDMVPLFYIDADDECPDVRDVIDICRETGAISAYAYLGDVTESVTGDKKRQRFEDDYIELLFDVIKGLGFNAVTYMPSRNTIEQVRRIKMLCEKYSFFQISGEDINSPRQSFVCQKLKDEEFSNLRDSTWALIGHEKAATEDLSKGMFSNETVKKYPDLNERIIVYKELSKCASRGK